MTTSAGGGPTPEQAREAARRILEQDRFRPDPPSRPPQPFKQPLTWLGEQLQRLLRPIGRFLSDTIGAAGPWGGSCSPRSCA